MSEPAPEPSVVPCNISSCQSLGCKVLTVTTNFLMFCSTGCVNGVAFMVGASGFECAAGVGKIYTESIGGKGKL